MPNLWPQSRGISSASEKRRRVNHAPYPLMPTRLPQATGPYLRVVSAIENIVCRDNVDRKSQSQLRRVPGSSTVDASDVLTTIVWYHSPILSYFGDSMCLKIVPSDVMDAYLKAGDFCVSDMDNEKFPWWILTDLYRYSAGRYQVQGQMVTNVKFLNPISSLKFDGGEWGLR